MTKMLTPDERAAYRAGLTRSGRGRVGGSDLEEQLWPLLEPLGFVREYRFAAPRRWRFDFAEPRRKVALEVEGGVWSGGRHTRGAGYEADAEKYSEAAILGWAVIRATTGQVKSGEALAWVQRALAARAP